MNQDGNFLYHDPNQVMSTSLSYPHSEEYEYESSIELINFEKERELDIATGRGFIVEPSKNIKKDLKAEDGIFSPKFGQTLSDVDPFVDRYKCGCGKLKGKIHSGMRCPDCGKICRYVGDDFSYFGWMVLVDPFKIIHPAFYKKIESFLGKGMSVQGAKRTKLDNIIEISDLKDQYEMQDPKKAADKFKDEPWFGIGMIEFVNHFDEIMEFYLKKKPQKQIYYDDIYAHRDMVFTNSIPVFTTLLRPFDTRDNTMSYEPTNGMYAMMNKLVTIINKNRSKMERELKTKNRSLYNLQKKFMKLYGELESILSGKKGDFRCLLGGRYNFSSRSVIVQNPDLRTDEITLSAVGLTILLEQRIKNILHRFYNIQPADAHAEWYKSTITPTKRVIGIIQSIIDDYKKKGMRGIPIIINRNPTIQYGSIVFMFCIGITNTYTMAVPLQPLKGLGADFDGKLYCPLRLERPKRYF